MYSSSAKMFFGLSVFFVVVLTVDGLFVSAGAMGSGKKSVSSEKRGPPWNKFGAFVKSKFAKSSKRSESTEDDSALEVENEKQTERELDNFILNMLKESDEFELQDQKKKEEEIPRFNKKDVNLKDVNLNNDANLPRFDKREKNEIKKETADKGSSNSQGGSDEKTWRELVGYLFDAIKENEIAQKKEEKKEEENIPRFDKREKMEELPMSFIGGSSLAGVKKGTK